MHSLAPRRAARLLLAAARNAGTLWALYDPDQPRDEQGQWTPGRNGAAKKGRTITRLKERLPLATNPHETQFLLPDGTRLQGRSFEEKVSHVNAAGGMQEFLDAVEAGVVRYKPGEGIEVSAPLTETQARVVADDWNTTFAHVGKVYVDFTHEDYGDTEEFSLPVNADALRNWTKRMARSLEFNPDQPRDEQGQWTDGGDSSARDTAGIDEAVRTDTEIVGIPVYRDPSVTDDEAPKKLAAFAKDIKPEILEAANIRAIHVYDNSGDAEAAIQLMLGARVDVPEGTHGVFDRESRTVVATLWRSGGFEETGETFFHEVGHASEHLITDPKWEEPWTREWNDYDQDEGFAHAFADYHLSKREGSGGDYGDKGEFARLKPLTYALFQEWDL